MYVRVPDTSATAISTVTTANQSGRIMKIIENGRIIIFKNGFRYNIQGQII
jgi:hypothetical protein